jgi:galactose mutarotase-like enzyme
MSALSRRASGEAAVGELISLFDEDARSRVTIAPERGGLVTSFSVAGRELLYLDPATLNDGTKNVRGGIPVLFPAPGKLEHDRFRWGGQSGELKQHGFARNLRFEVEKADPARAELVLRLRSGVTTLAMFPWEFSLELGFRLEGARLVIASRIANESTRVMPCALGYHPYFLVQDKAHTNVELRATRVFDNVKKAYGPFTGFDLNAPELDLHLLDNPRDSGALAFGDGTRVVVRGSPAFTTWIVWAVAGKDYICLEPWTAPGNALNTGEKLSELRPGTAVEASIEIELR